MSNFPLEGDVGESDELLSKGWGPGAPEAYAASLQSFRVGLEPPSGLAMGLRPEESLPEPVPSWSQGAVCVQWSH